MILFLEMDKSFPTSSFESLLRIPFEIRDCFVIYASGFHLRDEEAEIHGKTEKGFAGEVSGRAWVQIPLLSHCVQIVVVHLASFSKKLG